jgi:hypothetical protein
MCLVFESTIIVCHLGLVGSLDVLCLDGTQPLLISIFMFLASPSKEIVDLGFPVLYYHVTCLAGFHLK